MCGHKVFLTGVNEFCQNRPQKILFYTRSKKTMKWPNGKSFYLLANCFKKDKWQS